MWSVSGSLPFTMIDFSTLAMAITCQTHLHVKPLYSLHALITCFYFLNLTDFSTFSSHGILGKELPICEKAS